MKTAHFTIGGELIVPEMENLEGLDYAIVEYGGDCCGRNGVEDFRRIYSLTADEILDSGVTPVILSLPPVEISRWLDAGSPYLWHESVNMELCRFAHENGFPFIDITTPILKSGKIAAYLDKAGTRLNELGRAFVNTIVSDRLALC